MKWNQGSWRSAVLPIAALGLVAIVYWPVHLAGFFWVEKIWLHDLAWLRSGNEWTHLIFRPFGEWANYFRPFVTAILVAEDRLFDVAPGPMHLVSLGVHLASTLLVGAIASRMLHGTAVRFGVMPLLAMVFYGLHAALIEPVAWIACQFELFCTLFVLLGILLNLTLRILWVRAAVLSVVFLIAACCKEAAIVFLPLIVLFDWARSHNPLGGLKALGVSIRQNLPVYISIIGAGIVYLVIRRFSLGFFVQGHDGGAPLIQRVQEIGWTYLTYWRVILWPMIDQGPVHFVSAERFSRVDAESLAFDLSATAIVLIGLYLALLRKSAGFLLTAVTISLFPVLHIIPIEFDPSAYHERYASLAVAMVAVFGSAMPVATSTRLKVIVGTCLLIWLSLSVFTIRTTLPLWSDEVKIWNWVLLRDPGSTVAKDHLLSTYIERGRNDDARRLGDALIAEKSTCANCMLNIANLALAEADRHRAAAALDAIKDSPQVASQPRLLQGYVLCRAQLLELDGDEEAENAFRAAISMDPLDPQAQMGLAIFLAHQGKLAQAREQGEKALLLFAPDEQPVRRSMLERALRADNPVR